jgi:hypothetical protein
MVFVGVIACADTETPEEANAEEVISTVRLTFEPEGGGESVVATWRDETLLDGSSNDAGLGAFELQRDTTYAMAVAFLNELEDPAEDITVEVDAEAEEHQVFITGSAVEGPATGTRADAPLVHAYADADAAGLPVGLRNTATVRASGSGTLDVTLRHLPELGGAPGKVAGLAETVAESGLGAVPGESDVSVSFDVTVP